MTPTSGKQSAVVTGASRGIGYELGKQFAQHGFDILIASEDAGSTTPRERSRNAAPRSMSRRPT